MTLRVASASHHQALLRLLFTLALLALPGLACQVVGTHGTTGKDSTQGSQYTEPHRYTVLADGRIVCQSRNDDPLCRSNIAIILDEE